MNPAIFLDRDDTLIEDMGYSADVDRVRLKPGAAEALKRLRNAGYYIVVVTNQSGLARGCFTEEQLANVHQRMQHELRSGGGGMDAVYYCPFLPGPEAVVERYRRDSTLRKPSPGMLLQAAEELELDLSASWMIGDAQRDVEAGRAVGCRTILIGAAAEGPPPTADFTASDLRSAAELVLSNGHREAAPPPAPSTTPPAASEPPRDAERTAPRRPDTGDAILRELRQWRREARSTDFTTGHLVGAVAQAFAVAALFWALSGLFDTGPSDAQPITVRLLLAMALQLVAITYLGRRR
ncbi:MAG: HAD family hydrolase [Phycisphaerae bacterium]